MEIIWLGGDINKQIAAHLKSLRVIDDYEFNAVSTVLIINQDRATVYRSDFDRAVEAVTGQHPDDRVWFAAWRNVIGGRIEEMDETRVVLVSVVEKRVLSVRIPKDLHEALLKEAGERGISLTELVIERLRGRGGMAHEG